MNLRILQCALIALLALGWGIGAAETNRVSQAAAVHRAWAERIERPGIGNLHRISDRLYRGAQPTEEGMAELKKMGIRTVISLRAHHDDEKKVDGTGLKVVRIPIDTWDLKPEHVVRFLRTVQDPKNGPIFVHCKHGADRTGTMCAIYRIVVDGWTREEAIAEMTQGGFGFHKIWKNLVELVRTIDLDAIREKLKQPAKE